MAFDNLQSLEVIEAMENFLSNVRPEESLRDEVDVSYQIEDQSVIIFEIRHTRTKPRIMIEMKIAKATFVKSKDHWKVFWMRSNQNWELYRPKPHVQNIKEFADLVKEDRHSCFFG